MCLFLLSSFFSGWGLAATPKQKQKQIAENDLISVIFVSALVFTCFPSFFWYVSVWEGLSVVVSLCLCACVV